MSTNSTIVAMATLLLSSASAYGCGSDGDRGSGGSGGGSGSVGNAGSGTGGADGSSTGGTGTGGSGGQTASELCKDVAAMLANHNTTLNCTNGASPTEAECIAALGAKPQCEAPLKTLYDCVVHRFVDDSAFECNSDDKIVWRTTVCLHEQGYDACING